MAIHLGRDRNKKFKSVKNGACRPTESNGINISIVSQKVLIVNPKIMANASVIVRRIFVRVFGYMAKVLNNRP